MQQGTDAMRRGLLLALGMGGTERFGFCSRKGHMKDATGERALHRKTTRGEDPQHAIVFSEHIGLERGDPLLPGDLGQVFE
jgi:hypothetical protein